MAMQVGRYAPSPTGSLHLGNLRTALAAWVSARARGGRFLLRIEDLDGPRCRAESERQQLEDLAALGIDWDDEPIRQSQRASVYASILDQLERRRLAYPCFCSRKDIAHAASAPHATGTAAPYPGTCAALPHHEAMARVAAGTAHCWRLRVQGAPRGFLDGFAGDVAINLEEDGGDFVIRRADGIFAYQLACAVDDGVSGVTEVLRGGDLLDSGARQAWLLSCVGLPVPRYIHIPLMRGEDGARLAKRVGSEDMTGFLGRGFDETAIRSYLAWSLGQCGMGERITMEDLAGRWDIARVPREDVFLREKEMARFLV